MGAVATVETVFVGGPVHGHVFAADPLQPFHVDGGNGRRLTYRITLFDFDGQLLGLGQCEEVCRGIDAIRLVLQGFIASVHGSAIDLLPTAESLVFPHLVAAQPTCDECYGTGCYKGFGGPCSRGCRQK